MSEFFSLVQQLKNDIESLNAILLGDDAETVTIDGETKPSISKAITDQFASLNAMVHGRVSFETKAAMDTDLAHDADTLAEVWNDPTQDNNGLYGKVGVSGGGSWQKSSYDNFSLLQTDITGLEKQAAQLDVRLPDAVPQAGYRHSADALLRILQFAGLDATDEIVAAIGDDNGNAALAINNLGEVIVPLLRALNLKLGTDTLEATELNYALGLVDENNNVGFGVDVVTGRTIMALAKVMGALQLGDDVELVQGEFNYDFVIVDGADNPGFGIISGSVVTPGQSVSASVGSRDELNVAKSLQVKQAINTTCAKNIYDYNHLVVYGQSRSTGQEGWPVLSRSAQFGNVMLGGNVRPMNATGENFTPFGGVALQPLVAGVQSGSLLLTDMEVAALPEGDQAMGETVNCGMVNFAKKLHNRHRQLGNDEARVFVTTNCGVSGRTIEQLSKNNTQDSVLLYSRYTDALTQLKAIADGESKSYGVTGIVWMQGEWNYYDRGGNFDQATYKTLLTQLRDDMVADALTITGQGEEPVFITYQTGDSSTVDFDSAGNPGLHVGMAQWEFSRENANCFMAGPLYAYTDKGAHLDSNGYRWYGNQLGKVYHKVVTLGQDWEPLSPKKSQLVGRDIYVDFHVPEPPLAFDLPYVFSTPTDRASKGFRITDEVGEVPLSKVELAGETIVRLRLSRDPVGEALLWYADQTKNGAVGQLRDSDATVAHDVYEYKPEEGMYTSANRPELIGKPYPLHNWCIAFCIPINWEKS